MWVPPPRLFYCCSCYCITFILFYVSRKIFDGSAVNALSSRINLARTQSIRCIGGGSKKIVCRSCPLLLSSSQQQRLHSVPMLQLSRNDNSNKNNKNNWIGDLWSSSQQQRLHSVPMLQLSRNDNSNKNNNNNWIGDLWSELIEFSTYGPAERKILKAKREEKKKKAAGIDNSNSIKEEYDDNKNEDNSDDKFLVSIEAFQNAKNKKSLISSASTSSFKETSTSTTTDDAESSSSPDFDGYKLRDLLVKKWGVPLDVDFQRGDMNTAVYCSVLPVVGFGNATKSRHDTELDYLMHLQGIIEILNKYDNLDPFLLFLNTTNRIPKPGIGSVPYKLVLSPSSLKQILKLPPWGSWRK